MCWLTLNIKESIWKTLPFQILFNDRMISAYLHTRFYQCIFHSCPCNTMFLIFCDTKNCLSLNFSVGGFIFAIYVHYTWKWWPFVSAGCLCARHFQWIYCWIVIRAPKNKWKWMRSQLITVCFDSLSCVGEHTSATAVHSLSSCRHLTCNFVEIIQSRMKCDMKLQLVK